MLCHSPLNKNLMNNQLLRIELFQNKLGEPMASYTAACRVRSRRKTHMTRISQTIAKAKSDKNHGRANVADIVYGTQLLLTARCKLDRTQTREAREKSKCDAANHAIWAKRRAASLSSWSPARFSQRPEAAANDRLRSCSAPPTLRAV